MNQSRDSIVLLVCGAALAATCCFFSAADTTPRPVSSTSELTSSVVESDTHPTTTAEPEGKSAAQADFSPLMALILSEKERAGEEDSSSVVFGIPAVVASAADITEPERAKIFRALITDVLQSPDLQNSRDFYGTPGRRYAIVFTDGEVAFPRGFSVTVPGWTVYLRKSTYSPRHDSLRMVGIRIAKFAPEKPAGGFIDSHISVCMFNAGGNPDGVTHIGGCFVQYSLARSDDGWKIEGSGSFDP